MSGDQDIEVVSLAEARKQKRRKTNGRTSPFGQNAPAWTEKLICDPHSGRILSHVENAIIALRNAPEWRGVIRYDVFAMRTMLSRPPPWDTPAPPKVPCGWEDHFDTLTAAWLQRHARMSTITIGATAKAIESVARENSHHPVRDYLASLQWDGIERLDCWLIRYLGAEDNDYTRAVGAAFLISAVARVEQPGCKADCILVLEGPQGIGKSQVIPALFSPWVTDELAEPGSKDAAQQLSGVWCVEIAELAALKRAELERVKAFITRTVDRFRPPFERKVIEAPRQNVFIGSINLGSYLDDETGARRFWPVAVNRIDLDALRADRDQLLAEALGRFKAGEAWWIDGIAASSVADAVQQEQSDRYREDPWTEKVAKFIALKHSVSTAEVLEECLFIPVGNWARGDEMRVARILKRLKWERKRVPTAPGSPREWRYLPARPVPTSPAMSQPENEVGTA